MLNPDTELIFPLRVLPELKNFRSEIWGSLIEKTINKSYDLSGQIAMILLMTRVAGCITCNADSYRAIRGCTLCAQQSLKRFKGSDKELENYYEKYQEKANKFLEKKIIEAEKGQ
jgi:hypothetical protein